MFECQQEFQRRQDGLRGMLLSDPRGSVNAAVNLVTPPIHPEAHFGMIVIESDYYPPMSGSNLMCTVTAVLETGMVPMKEPVTELRVDTPAGIVRVRAECSEGKCRRVSFSNVPSFVMHSQKSVEVPGFGTISVDVAYGGMIYVIVDAAALEFRLDRSEARALVNAGERIKLAAAEQLPAVHPENPGIHTINQTLFAGPITMENGVKTSKNAVVVSPGRLDRSPCGTGSSARLALLHARGELAVGERFTHLSLLDTRFDCIIEEAATVGGMKAVIPNVSGRAWLTGVSYYGTDPEDPFPEGYRLNDTWFAC
jgi:proline racemase